MHEVVGMKRQLFEVHVDLVGGVSPNRAQRDCGRLVSDQSYSELSVFQGRGAESEVPHTVRYGPESGAGDEDLRAGEVSAGGIVSNGTGDRGEAGSARLRGRQPHNREQEQNCRDEGSHNHTPQPNAPRLSCAARACGRTGMIAGARQYVGAQMEFCQGRAAQLQPLVRRQAFGPERPLQRRPHK